MRCAVAILLLLSAAAGQVVQVVGGTSTLLRGSGGGATVYLPNSQVYAGVGCDDMGCGFGVSQKFRAHKAIVTLGDSNVSASVDGGGVGINVRGVTVEKGNLTAFIGATGAGYQTPFVQTQKAQHIGAGVAYTRHVGAFTLQGVAVISGGQRSAALSGRYVTSRFGFTAAGGVLLNNPFLNGAAEFAPIKNHLKLSAVREQFYLPDAPSAATNSVSASAAIGFVSMHATALRGTAGARTTNGGNIGAGLNLGAVSVQANYFATAAQRLVTTTASEHIGRHWIASQTLTGSNQFAFGGGYTSNRITVSVDHQVMFFPIGGRGFQSVTDFQISLRIPHTDAVANFGNTFLPDGSMKWTTYGSDYLRGPLQSSAGPQSSYVRSAGNYIVRGMVVDNTGKPVYGAVVALGAATVISGEDGTFFLRLRHGKPVSVVVKPAEFATAGLWRVVSAPSTATPSRTESEILTIVVERQ